MSQFNINLGEIDGRRLLGFGDSKWLNWTHFA
jgi:hypothetical protein